MASRCTPTCTKTNATMRVHRGGIKDVTLKIKKKKQPFVPSSVQLFGGEGRT